MKGRIPLLVMVAAFCIGMVYSSDEERAPCDMTDRFMVDIYIYIDLHHLNKHCYSTNVGKLPLFENGRRVLPHQDELWIYSI